MMTKPKPPVAPKVASTVTVASKLPMDIELQLCRIEFKPITGRHGTTNEPNAIKYGPIYVVRGTAKPNGEVPAGYQMPDLHSGAALTPNVPADFWAEWMAQNAETDMVRNGLVFATASRESSKAKAREMAGIRTGLEPIDPTVKQDPRVPRPLSNKISGVTIATVD